MRAQHINRAKRAWQMGLGRKGNCLLAVFLVALFMGFPRPLAAQDMQDDRPKDESTVAATIEAADADLENDQANADKAKPGADSDAAAEDSPNQAQNQTLSESSSEAAHPASDQLPNGAEQASPALESSAASANGAGITNPEPAANAQNTSEARSAPVAPGPAPGNAVVTSSDPKSELALDSASLMKLANDLKSEVDKTSKDTLSVTVVREAAQIEQLAHKMRSK